MAIIGTFTPTKDGGWTGSIHTLTINAKLRLLPSDSRNHPQAPAFRVFAGTTRVGDYPGTGKRPPPDRAGRSTRRMLTSKATQMQGTTPQ